MRAAIILVDILTLDLFPRDSIYVLFTLLTTLKMDTFLYLTYSLK